MSNMIVDDGDGGRQWGGNEMREGGGWKGKEGEDDGGRKGAGRREWGYM